MKKKGKELLRLVCKLSLKQKKQPWITLETTKFLIVRTTWFWRERGSNPSHYSGISSSADKTDVAGLPARAQDCSQQEVSSAKNYPINTDRKKSTLPLSVTPKDALNSIYFWQFRIKLYLLLLWKWKVLPLLSFYSFCMVQSGWITEV